MKLTGLLILDFTLVTKEGADRGKWYCTLCRGRPMKDIRPHQRLRSHIGNMELRDIPPREQTPLPTVEGLLQVDVESEWPTQLPGDATLDTLFDGQAGLSPSQYTNHSSLLDFESTSDSESEARTQLPYYEDLLGFDSSEGGEQSSSHDINETITEPVVDMPILATSGGEPWYPFKREEVRRCIWVYTSN